MAIAARRFSATVAESFRPILDTQESRDDRAQFLEHRRGDLTRLEISGLNEPIGNCHDPGKVERQVRLERIVIPCDRRDQHRGESPQLEEPLPDRAVMTGAPCHA